MPWHIEKRDGEFCVIKDADSSVTACHATRPEAIAQIRALYAGELEDDTPTSMNDAAVHAFALNDDDSLAEPLEPVDMVSLAREIDVNLPGGPGHQLRNYWVKGPGAGKIGWGTDGSFARCVLQLSKHVKDPQGLCAEYHKAATGEWPAEKGVPSSGDIEAFHGTHNQKSHGNDGGPDDVRVTVGPHIGKGGTPNALARGGRSVRTRSEAEDVWAHIADLDDRPDDDEFSRLYDLAESTLDIDRSRANAAMRKLSQLDDSSNDDDDDDGSYTSKNRVVMHGTHNQKSHGNDNAGKGEWLGGHVSYNASAALRKIDAIREKLAHKDSENNYLVGIVRDLYDDGENFKPSALQSMLGNMYLDDFAAEAAIKKIIKDLIAAKAAADAAKPEIDEFFSADVTSAALNTEINDAPVQDTGVDVDVDVDVDAQTAPWEGVLTVEGIESGDGRLFADGSLTWDEVPLPLRWQKETAHGGQNDVTVRVGSITKVWRTPDPQGRPGVNAIMSRGVIDLQNPDGAEAYRRMRGGFMEGNSVDVDSVKDAFVELVYPQVPELLQGAINEGAPLGQPELTIYHKGRIRATTLVDIPAFTEAKLHCTDTVTADVKTADNVVDDDKYDYSFAVAHAANTSYSDGAWSAANTERQLPSPLPFETAKKVYAWVATDQVTNGIVAKIAGKLPHHDVNADGTPGTANLTAVSAAISALHGSRGHRVAIPEVERRAVYDHLAAHLRAAGKEPPPFNSDNEPLTAAVHTMTITDVPPAWWFDEPTDVTPLGALTVTDEGRLYGYIAPDKVRHRSFANRDQYVPMKKVDYTRFMGGETIVAGGGRVTTGVITMGCGHATTSYQLTAAEASEHYDNTCSMVASVSVGENKNGVWVAGALMPGVTPEQVTRIMASRLSGDWRGHLDKPGWREFVAALLVPVPGFPMARVSPSVIVSDGALVASSVPVRFVHGSDEYTGEDMGRIEELEAQVAHYRGQVVAGLRQQIGRDRTSRVTALRDRVVSMHGTHNQKSHGNDSPSTSGQTELKKVSDKLLQALTELPADAQEAFIVAYEAAKKRPRAMKRGDHIVRNVAEAQEVWAYIAALKDRPNDNAKYDQLVDLAKSSGIMDGVEANNALQKLMTLDADHAPNYVRRDGTRSRIVD